MSSSSTPSVFDRRLLRERRDRAASGFHDHDFLVRESGARLVERLQDVRRCFETGLVLGAHTGQLAEALLPTNKVSHLIQADLSVGMMRRASGLRVVLDEEALPFGANRFDLVVACCNLHAVNDLPGTLAQIRYSLKPDGFFLAAMPGGRTLHELREALMQAEIEAEGGAGPRVSPFVDIRDAGALMQRAGFAMPVIDIETLTVTYDAPFGLWRDLRGMGESNILRDRRRQPTRRLTALRAETIYQERFADDRGRLPATFEFLMLSGWKPDPSQPTALRPGSGKTSLSKALATPPLKVVESKN